MLGQVDRVVAVIVWIAAALVVIMLFVGPQVVAEDKPQQAAGPTATTGGGGAGADGRQVFTDNCGTCHTFEPAGTSGQTGPPLDGAGLTADAVTNIVRSGSGAMPAFADQLSPAEIDAVAAFVAENQ